jgi:hypothetical protein
MHRGYLALWRKFQDHPFWRERREFSKAEAWIDLLWEVQHDEKPQQVILKMKTLICNYGESLKSLDTWAMRWLWPKSRVKRFFDLLVELNQIQIKNETITTRITILNYSQYDPKRNVNKTQTKRVRNDHETEVKPDKNDKNVNNDKNVYGEYKNVLLTLEEYNTLILRSNAKAVKDKLESLSYGLETKKYKHTNHYITILGWLRKDGLLKELEEIKTASSTPKRVECPKCFANMKESELIDGKCRVCEELIIKTKAGTK